MRGDVVLDDGGVPGDLPEGAAFGEAAEELGFAGVEAEEVAGVGELVAGLAEQHPGLGVGEQAHGDFGGGGAVVGLGAQVGEAVHDGEVGDAVVAAELPAGLEVAGGLFGAEEPPGFVEDLEAMDAVAAGEHGLEPGGGGEQDEAQRFVVVVHDREVEDEAGAGPVDVDGGGAVEHASQGTLEELLEAIDDGFEPSAERGGLEAGALGHVGAGIPERPDKVFEGGRVDIGVEVVESPGERGVFEGFEVAAQHPGEQGGDQVGLAAGELVALVGGAEGSGVEGVDAAGAARVELDDVEAERGGEGDVFAFGVEDGDPAAAAGAVEGGVVGGLGRVEDGQGPVEEALDEAGLAGAGLAGDEHVGVGDQAGLVGLEGVVGEAAAAGEQVGAEVDAAVSEAGFGQERVRAAEVRGGGAVAGHTQTSSHVAVQVRMLRRGVGDVPEGQRGGEGEVVLAVEGPQLEAGLGGDLLPFAGWVSRASGSKAVMVRKPV